MLLTEPNARSIDRNLALTLTKPIAHCIPATSCTRIPFSSSTSGSIKEIHLAPPDRKLTSTYPIPWAHCCNPYPRLGQCPRIKRSPKRYPPVTAISPIPSPTITRLPDTTNKEPTDLLLSLHTLMSAEGNLDLPPYRLVVFDLCVSCVSIYILISVIYPFSPLRLFP